MLVKAELERKKAETNELSHIRHSIVDSLDDSLLKNFRLAGIDQRLIDGQGSNSRGEV